MRGDWVVGVGSRNALSGGLSGKIIFAMNVQEVVSLNDYDGREPQEWSFKIMALNSLDLADRLGDYLCD